MDHRRGAREARTHTQHSSMVIDFQQHRRCPFMTSQLTRPAYSESRRLETQLQSPTVELPGQDFNNTAS